MSDEPSAGRSLYQKLRLYTMFSLAIAAFIVILQNTDNVETQILFWSLTMPRAALLAAALLTGFAAGVIWSGFRRRK